MGFHKNFSAGGTDTSDATAEQWDIKNGQTAYIASGKVTGTAYTPAMMEFGSTGYYSLSAVTWNFASGITCVGRFTKLPHLASSSANEVLAYFRGTNHIQLQIATLPSDDADASRQGSMSFFVTSSAGATICHLITNTDVTDGNPHTFFFEYDPSGGTAQLILDGSSDINTGATGYTAPTTGTIETGSGIKTIGARNAGTADRHWAQTDTAECGFFGVIGTTGLTYSDFFQTDGSPKEQNTTVWASSGFGAQPLVFNPHGDLVNNLGSSGAWTKNNTINVGDGGVGG